MESGVQRKQDISGSSYPTFYIKSTKGAYYLQNAGAKECLVTTKSSTDNLNVWAIGYQGSASIKVSGKTSTYYVTGLYNQGNSRMLAHQSSDWRCQASTVWNNLSGRVIQIYKLTPSCSDPVAPENGSFFLSHFFSTKICSVSFVSIVSFKN